MRTLNHHPDISVIVPVYQEEAMIEPFLIRLEAVLQAIAKPYEVIFCLDPSRDNTEIIIKQHIERNPRIKLLLFSRRFGQAAATMAGIHHASGHCAVTIDVDLQDPPELIMEMVQRINQGDDVVYARRLSRQGETPVKLFVAKAGYRLIQSITDFSIPEDAGDYRMISARVITQLKAHKESNIYLRGLIAYMGFKSSIITYHRESRLKGTSKYSAFTGSISMGLDGVFGFSKRPLTLIFFMACLCFLIAFCSGITLLFKPVSLGSVIWASLGFFSGILLLALSLLGEYIGRIHDEVKQRPLYIVDEFLGKEDL